MPPEALPGSWGGRVPRAVLVRQTGSTGVSLACPWRVPGVCWPCPGAASDPRSGLPYLLGSSSFYGRSYFHVLIPSSSQTFWAPLPGGEVSAQCPSWVWMGVRAEVLFPQLLPCGCPGAGSIPHHPVPQEPSLTPLGFALALPSPPTAWAPACTDK